MKNDWCSYVINIGIRYPVKCMVPLCCKNIVVERSLHIAHNLNSDSSPPVNIYVEKNTAYTK